MQVHFLILWSLLEGGVERTIYVQLFIPSICWTKMIPFQVWVLLSVNYRNANHLLLCASALNSSIDLLKYNSDSLLLCDIYPKRYSKPILRSVSEIPFMVVFLLFQLEVQSCCVFIPNDSLPSPSTIVSGDIPGTVRSWYHGQASMPGTLVLCLPQVKILSAGHKYMEALQEIPFVVQRPILEEGKHNKFK